MTLRKDSTGRFMIECVNPDCKLLHVVKRNRNYEEKPQIRFRCSACKTTWYATEAERKAIAEAYSQPVKRRTKKPEQQEPKPEPEEKSFWDKLLS